MHPFFNSALTGDQYAEQSAQYNRMVCWNVYSGKSLINSVYYNTNCDEDYIRSSLIEHDGYPTHIRVVRAS